MPKLSILSKKRFTIYTGLLIGIDKSVSLVKTGTAKKLCRRLRPRLRKVAAVLRISYSYTIGYHLGIVLN